MSGESSESMKFLRSWKLLQIKRRIGISNAEGPKKEGKEKKGVGLRKKVENMKKKKVEYDSMRIPTRKLQKTSNNSQQMR